MERHHWPRAVLFDFDGTLADGYPGITAAVNAVRARHGQPPITREEVRPHVGHGLEHCLEGTVPGVDLAVDVSYYRQVYTDVMMEGTRLLPGAAEVTAALATAGVRLAVCSNKLRPFTASLLEYLGLMPHITAVLGPDDVPHPKPAPYMIHAALTRVGVTAADALYVGDMTVDIQCARAAGVRVWVVPTGSESRDSLAAAGPDRVLDSLADLLTLAPKA